MRAGTIVLSLGIMCSVAALSQPHHATPSTDDRVIAHGIPSDSERVQSMDKFINHLEVWNDGKPVDKWSRLDHREQYMRARTERDRLAMKAGLSCSR